MEKFRIENGELIFPQGITKVDKNIFRNDKGGDYAFEREAVTTVFIPESVTEIGQQAFDGFKNLKKLSIANSVKSIGDVAFRDCISLKELFIPVSVETIAEDAFFCCSALESIIVEEGNPNYDSRNDCNAIIETATRKLIQGCNNSIIPSTVEAISHSAFMNCASLEEIDIPNSVQSIGDAAFWGCSNLKTLRINNSHVQIGMQAFYDTPHADKNPIYISKREQRGKKSGWYQ